MVRLVDGQIVASADRTTTAHEGAECFGQRLSWWSFAALVLVVVIFSGGRGLVLVAVAAVCYRAFVGRGVAGSRAGPPSTTRIKTLGDLPPTPAAAGG